MLHPQEHLAAGRAHLELQAWIAEANGLPVGSAVAQRFGGFVGPVRLTELGYLWGVHVVPEARRLGVGKLLTNTAGLLV